jgi:hypothetical protein
MLLFSFEVLLLNGYFHERYHFSKFEVFYPIFELGTIMQIKTSWIIYIGILTHTN